MDEKLRAQIAKEAKTTVENIIDYKVFSWGLVEFAQANTPSEYSVKLTKTGRVKKGSLRYERTNS